jgi:hypothetical protein
MDCWASSSHNCSCHLVLLTRAQSGVGTGPIAASAERFDERRCSSADVLMLMTHLCGTRPYNRFCGGYNPHPTL